MTAPASSADNVYVNLRSEFIAEALDRVEEMEACLNELYSGAVDSHGALRIIKQETHTIKGLASPFGFPTLTSVTHDFEDFLNNISMESSEFSKPIQMYLDLVGRALRRGEDIDAGEGAMLLQGLSAFSSLRKTDDDKPVIEILLVSGSRTVTRMVTNVLEDIGFRVHCVPTGLEGISLSIRSRPDIVISADVLEDISGIDLVNALVAMPSTSRLPVVFMTSYDLDHPSLADLPSDIPILPVGPEMANQLLSALTEIEYRFIDH